MRGKRAIRECQRLYAEALADVANIRVVELAPGESPPPGYPSKDVIYTQLRPDPEEDE